MYPILRRKSLCGGFPPPCRPVLDPKFATNSTKKAPATTHLANDEKESPNAKEAANSLPAEPDPTNPNPVTPDEERSVGELRKLRGGFYLSRKFCQTSMIITESPLILLGSGASRSAGGLTWLKWWNGWDDFMLSQSERSFRFGGGPMIRSSGTIIIFTRVGQ